MDFPHGGKSSLSQALEMLKSELKHMYLFYIISMSFVLRGVTSLQFLLSRSEQE